MSEKNELEIKFQKGWVDDLANQISQKLKLTFISEKETQCQVCFATSQELRAEFKTSFTTNDILDYSYALINVPPYNAKNKPLSEIDLQKIPCPENRETFWKLVALGFKIRQMPADKTPLSGI